MTATTLSGHPVFKGPATLYVLRMTAAGAACVLTSTNERAGVPSAKMRLPVPNRTGETISTTFREVVFELPST